MIRDSDDDSVEPPLLPGDLKAALGADGIERMLLDLQGAGMMMLDRSEEGGAPAPSPAASPNLPATLEPFTRLRSELGVSATERPALPRPEVDLPPAPPALPPPEPSRPAPAPASERRVPRAVRRAGIGAGLALVASSGLAALGAAAALAVVVWLWAG